MIYQLAILFTSTVWKYLALLLIIITVRGDISKAIKATGDKLRVNYQAYKLRREQAKQNEKQILETINNKFHKG